MTEPARILQADISRALRAAASAAPESRIIIDHERRRIEIILGPQPKTDSPETDSEDDPWKDDHGGTQAVAPRKRHCL